jgi:hypothetical protein
VLPVRGADNLTTSEELGSLKEIRTECLRNMSIRLPLEVICLVIVLAWHETQDTLKNASLIEVTVS